MARAENLKWQERDFSDSCKEAGKEKLVGFGEKFSETVNVKHEMVLNLKVQLTCGTSGH